MDLDGFDPFIGINVFADVTERVQIKLEAERWYLDGDHVDFISAGVQVVIL